MCGIWAIFGSDGDVTKQVRCSFTIAHRGPDAYCVETFHQYPSCCMAFHHLAIMDLVYGMQPMKIASLPHLWMVYNGEIYNYKKVQEEYGFEYQTESDGEAIIHLYNKFGMAHAAAMLDGVFACCLLDLKAGKVFISRDTYGVKPVFRLLKKDGFLAVCSEGKGLMELLQGNGSIEPCLPGYYEEYDLAKNGKVTQVAHRQFHSLENLPMWRNIVKNCHPIKGGLDSSLTAALVVSLARETGIKYPIQTFTIGMEDSPDAMAAKKVAKHLGTEHHEVLFSPEEGLGVLKEVIKCLETYDSDTIHGSVALYLLSRYIKERTDTVVLFSGEGSDELAQGYSYFHKAPSPQEGDADSRKLLKNISFFDVVRADRTTSAHGLELRMPFLDHYFTSYYLSLPAELRAPQNGIEKYLLRRSFEKQNLIPDDVLWRPKEIFSIGIASAKTSWEEVLQESIEAKVTENMMKEAPDRFPFNTPTTKEGYYYRQVFETYYPGQARLIPCFWKAKWIKDQ
ncbi:asparagine synthetase [glutamine-hydrolyzing]-like [Amphiura filiformis]|uniref:asparagine synthetase [glutamine-hydrolyzing]-like n=1 Tax=Amphiura filiformis TaxID=82378 RepID=UPI003B2234A4